MGRGRNKKTAKEKPAAKPADDKPAVPEEGKAEAAPAQTEPDGAAPAPAPDLGITPERFLRLQADFENFRKRTLRERTDLYRRANEDIMEELLPVLDHMDLALEAARAHDADEAMVEGFRLASEQLWTALGKFGLKPIDTDGVAFDPNLHEAVSHLPSDDVPENHVMVQTRRGYKLGDSLLRAAQVVVSSGKAAAAESDGNDGTEA